MEELPGKYWAQTLHNRNIWSRLKFCVPSNWRCEGDTISQTILPPRSVRACRVIGHHRTHRAGVEENNPWHWGTAWDSNTLFFIPDTKSPLKQNIPSLTRGENDVALLKQRVPWKSSFQFMRSFGFNAENNRSGLPGSKFKTLSLYWSTFKTQQEETQKHLIANDADTIQDVAWV